jgi:hypothetical protein
MPASIETPAVIHNPAIVSGSSGSIRISLFTILKLTLSDVKYVPIAK